MSVVLLFTGLFSAADLKNTKWVLAGWSISSHNPADFKITLDFTAKSFSGQTTVNSYGGEYRAYKDGRFEITGIRSTLMAGSPEDMEIETDYYALLNNVKKYTKTGSVLTLLDANGNQLLIFEKASKA